jgi:hypothetical protein
VHTATISGALFHTFQPVSGIGVSQKNSERAKPVKRSNYEHSLTEYSRHSQPNH